MNEKIWSGARLRAGLWLGAVLLGCVALEFGGVGRAQTGPSRLVVFADVVKLAQAHQSDDVILAYIKGSGGSFTLSVDEIIYLSNQGVSQPVISALQSKNPGAPPAIPAAPLANNPPPFNPGPPPAGAVPVAPAAPENPEVTFDYFHSRLAADGTWMDVPGYGACWRPTAAAVNPEWRPYYDHGHWAYTDNGWFWQSDEQWGEIAFHYGRWHQDPIQGWLWVPAYDWAPSWVSWRHSEGFLGWAPLPPEARFTVGVGLFFNGRLAVDVDFGLTEAHYNFVGYDHFWEHDLYRYRVPRERVVILFRDSHLANSYRVEGHRMINEGYGREHIELVTHHTIIVERPVIHDPIISRHVEKTVLVVKTEPAHPAGHAEESKPAPEAAKPAAAAPASAGNRGNTYSSGSTASSTRPQPSSQSKTNKPAVKH